MARARGGSFTDNFTPSMASPRQRSLEAAARAGSSRALAQLHSVASVKSKDANHMMELLSTLDAQLEEALNRLHRGNVMHSKAE